MLPPAMETASRFNPVFYLIDGIRFALIGRSDASPQLGLIVVTAATLAAIALCWHWFRIGYHMKP
jgi:ABC-2 type transport system permease protein